jgi:hypothetical protein
MENDFFPFRTEQRRRTEPGVDEFFLLQQATSGHAIYFTLWAGPGAWAIDFLLLCGMLVLATQ